MRQDAHAFMWLWGCLGTRGRGTGRTPARKAFWCGRSSLLCGLHRRARARALLRVLRFGTVHDGAGCARRYRGTPYDAHVSEPRRIPFHVYMDGGHPILQCCARIDRRGPLARQDRDTSRVLLHWGGALAAPGGRRRVPFILRFLLVLVAPFVLARDAWIRDRFSCARSRADGRCAGSIGAILPPQQRGLPGEVLGAVCSLRGRGAGAILRRKTQHEAHVGAKSAVYRRRPLAPFRDRQWRARALWAVRLQRCGGRRPSFVIGRSGGKTCEN